MVKEHHQKAQGLIYQTCRHQGGIFTLHNWSGKSTDEQDCAVQRECALAVSKGSRATVSGWVPLSLWRMLRVVSAILLGKHFPLNASGATQLSVAIFCSIWFEANRISSEQTVCFHLLFVKQDSKQQCPTPPEKRPNEKGVPHRKRRSPQVPTSPRPFSTLENKAWRLSFLAPDEKAKETPERRRKRPKSLYKCFSFDDIWMQRNQKRKLEKERQPERGTQLQHFPEDQLKVRTHTLSSSSPGTVFLSLLWLFSTVNHIRVLLLCLVSVLAASLCVWQLWMETDYLNTKLSQLWRRWVL